MVDFIIIEYDMLFYEIVDFLKFFNILVMCYLIYRYVFFLGFMF